MIKTIKSFILFFVLIVHVVAHGQTQDSLLEKYSSIEQWLTPEDETYTIVNRFYEGGAEQFFNDLGHAIDYPNREYPYRASYPMVCLVNVSYKEGEFNVFLLNQVNSNFSRQIQMAFDTTFKKWSSESEFSINYSVSFSVNNDRSFDEGMLSLMTYSFPYEPECGEKCFQYSEETMYKIARGYYMSEELEGALFFSKKLCQMRPFNKEYHNLYNQVSSKINMN